MSRSRRRRAAAAVVVALAAGSAAAAASTARSQDGAAPRSVTGEVSRLDVRALDLDLPVEDVTR